jgi:hypothetical protein
MLNIKSYLHLSLINDEYDGALIKTVAAITCRDLCLMPSLRRSAPEEGTVVGFLPPTNQTHHSTASVFLLRLDVTVCVGVVSFSLIPRIESL